MKALRIAPDFFINADSIEVVQKWPSRAARREKQRAVDAGVFHDATGGRKTLSLITLRSGWVFASAYASATLIGRPVVAAPVRPSNRRGERFDEEDALQVLADVKEPAVVETPNVQPQADIETHSSKRWHNLIRRRNHRSI
jgi:regulator of extracellular matrix RemA (YlzA/DUF370 family)